jgi:hypothetical protein
MDLFHVPIRGQGFRGRAWQGLRLKIDRNRAGLLSLIRENGVVIKKWQRMEILASELKDFQTRRGLGVPIGTSMGGNHHRMVIS